MTYNPNNQYRCTIIRGKSQSDIDDLLPTYARLIDEMCPISKNKFPNAWRQKFAKVLIGATPKTLDNHRTEVVGKLFGMYHYDDEMVICSEQTSKLLKDNDHPAFFKDMCFKLQFPNGMDSIANVQEKINRKLKIRPCVFIVQFMILAHSKDFVPKVNEIGYYILNNLDVLRGEASPKEVLASIMQNRRDGVEKEVDQTSHGNQHIREILNYMELANLVFVKGGEIVPNNREVDSVEKFNDEDYTHLPFDIYAYSLDRIEEKRELEEAYAKYMGTLAFKDEAIFETPVEAISEEGQVVLSPDGEEIGAVELGGEGERVVFMYERAEVKKFNPRHVGRVVSMGKIKGIGYDIQSIHKRGDSPEDAIFIEVKSTKKTFPPSEKAFDNIVLTRNEYLCAKQKGEDFFVYRVYFTRQGIFIYKIQNPYKRSQDGSGEIILEAERFRMDFKPNPAQFVKMD